jgi:hypothetical protein
MIVKAFERLAAGAEVADFIEIQLEHVFKPTAYRSRPQTQLTVTNAFQPIECCLISSKTLKYLHKRIPCFKNTQKSSSIVNRAQRAVRGVGLR